MNEALKPVSEQVRAIIEARGLTAYGVAKKADLNVTSVRRWINGDRSLTLETFDRLCLGLKLRVVGVED